MTANAMLGVPGSPLAVGLLVLLVLCLLVAVVQRIGTRRAAEREPLTLEEEIEAAIELREIRRRLEVAKARSEIHRNGDSLRQKIMEELNERRS
jgi:Na+-transporting methylmalonyl-CoA/oxaloacetate decarboxylase gamma subunit